MRPVALFVLLAMVALALPPIPSGADASSYAPAGLAHAAAAPAEGSPPGFAAPVWRDLGPHGIRDASADDLEFELIDVTSAFGPESYKTDDLLNSRNPNDVDNQTTNWDTALGHHLELLVRIEGAEGTTLACDTRFDPLAYIETSAGRLYGWTNGTVAVPDASAPCPGTPGVRTFRMVFDIDGAPNNAGGDPFPALASGGAVANLELYYARTPSPTNPSGRGPLAGTFEVAFTVFHPVLTLRDERVMRFPDSIFRMFSDVGPGTETNMPMRALLPPVNLTTAPVAEIRFPGTPAGTPFEMVGWFPTRVAPSTQPSVPVPQQPETPLPGLADKASRSEDRGVRLRECGFEVPQDASTVPPDGVRFIAFPRFCREQLDPVEPDHWPLHVVGVHVPANLTSRSTGIGTMVVPLSERSFPLRGMEVTTVAGAPLTGATRVELLDSARVTGGPGGTDSGDLHALRVTGLGHAPITSVRLARENDDQWIIGSVPHVAFDDVAQYDLVSMLYGPRDEFLGMTIVRRGLDLGADSIRITEGRDGILRLGVRSLTTDFDDEVREDELELRVGVTGLGLPSGGNFTQTVTVPEDQTTFQEITIEGRTKGTYTVRFTATSGELVQRLDVGVQIVARSTDDDRWYTPGPSAALVALALVGVAAVARRRP